MEFDSTGLGYTARGGEVYVHYPVKDKRTGEIVYGAGFPITPLPDFYFTAPPNEITAERMVICQRLMGFYVQHEREAER